VIIAILFVWITWTIGMIVLDPHDPAPPPNPDQMCEANRQWWAHENPQDYQARIAHSEAEWERQKDTVPIPNPDTC
jgi:hypothetical protein